MKQFLTLTILITLFNLQSFTQENTGRISGFAKDMDKKQVEAATVALLRSSDSLQVKTTLTDNVRDMFYTQKVKGYINLQQTEASFRNIRDSRVANITFTYRFGTA